MHVGGALMVEAAVTKLIVSSVDICPRVQGARLHKVASAAILGGHRQVRGCWISVQRIVSL